MDDPTSLLFGLDGFVVLEVADVAGEDATVRVVVETGPGEAACPDCGVIASRIKDRPLCRIRTFLLVGSGCCCGGASVDWSAPRRDVNAGRSSSGSIRCRFGPG